MTTWKVILGCIGVLAALFALAAFTAWVEKVRPNDDYDERQKLLRGKAYRFSYTVGSFLFIVAFFYLEKGPAPEVKASAILLICLLVQLVAFHVYCLIKDVSLPLGDRGWMTVIGYLAVGISNLINYRNRVRYIEVYEQYIKAEPNSTLPDPVSGIDTVLFLVLGVTALTMAAMHFVRMLWPQKE